MKLIPFKNLHNAASVKYVHSQSHGICKLATRNSGNIQRKYGSPTGLISNYSECSNQQKSLYSKSYFGRRMILWSMTLRKSSIGNTKIGLVCEALCLDWLFVKQIRIKINWSLQFAFIVKILKTATNHTITFLHWSNIY
jgi:hypothetical protein